MKGNGGKSPGFLPSSPCMPAWRAMTTDQWFEYLKKTKGWAVRIGFDLLHSESYKKLNYGPALKVLNWFYEKIQLEKIKGKRGKNRFQIIDRNISFTYREAGFRGLSSHQFAKALKELHKSGFIDIEKSGSALKGDWTQFAISERWKEYGSPNFKNEEFPKSVHWVNFGFGAKKKRKKLRCQN